MRVFFCCIAALCLMLSTLKPVLADEINVFSEGLRYGKVDTVTGTFTQLGSSLVLMEGMTRIGAGTLFGMDNTQTLRSINPNNGSSSGIGFSGNSILSIAQRPSDLILFSVSSGAAGASLYTINQGNGISTLVGSLGIGTHWYNIAFSASSTLFLVEAPSGRGANSNLYSVSTTTGAVTLIGAVGQTGNNFNVTSVVFSNGVLFGFTDRTSVTAPDHLITINTLTGAGTDTGLSYANNGFPATDVIYAAAPAAVPEPTTLLYCGAGIFVTSVWLIRRRRSKLFNVELTTSADLI